MAPVIIETYRARTRTFAESVEMNVQREARGGGNGKLDLVYGTSDYGVIGDWS